LRWEWSICSDTAHGPSRARHERLERVAGLLRRKDLAIEIVEAEIRAAQHEILLEPGA